MANDLKTQGDLKLNVPEGVNAHLMVQSFNPVRSAKPIEKVGYWFSTDEKGEVGDTVWFDVDGDLKAAQAVIDSKVLPALKEAASPAPEPETPEPLFVSKASAFKPAKEK